MITKTYTLKGFETAVRNTVKSEMRLKDVYQEYGMYAMRHLATTGDTSYLGALVSIMSTRSPYRSKMLKWVKMFAPVQPEKDDTRKLDNGDPGLKYKVRKGESWQTGVNLEGAAETPFWAIDGEDAGVLKTLDLGKLLKIAVAKHQKAVAGEDPKIGMVTDVKPGELDKMLKLADALEMRGKVKVHHQEQESENEMKDVTPRPAIEANAA